MITKVSLSYAHFSATDLRFHDFFLTFRIHSSNYYSNKKTKDRLGDEERRLMHQVVCGPPGNRDMESVLSLTRLQVLVDHQIPMTNRYRNYDLLLTVEDWILMSACCLAFNRTS